MLGPCHVAEGPQTDITQDLHLLPPHQKMKGSHLFQPSNREEKSNVKNENKRTNKTRKKKQNKKSKSEQKSIEKNENEVFTYQAPTIKNLSSQKWRLPSKKTVIRAQLKAGCRRVNKQKSIKENNKKTGKKISVNNKFHQPSPQSSSQLTNIEEIPQIDGFNELSDDDELEMNIVDNEEWLPLSKFIEDYLLKRGKDSSYASRISKSQGYLNIWSNYGFSLSQLRQKFNDENLEAFLQKKYNEKDNLGKTQMQGAHGFLVKYFLNEIEQNQPSPFSQLDGGDSLPRNDIQRNSDMVEDNNSEDEGFTSDEQEQVDSDFDEEEDMKYYKSKDPLEFGALFKSLETFNKKLENFCSRTFCPLVISSSHKGGEGQKHGRIQLKCPHGIKRKSRAKTGKRPYQYINHTGCTAYLNLNQMRTGDWHVTNINLQHTGHELGPKIYRGYRHVRKLSSYDWKYVTEMIEVGARPRKIAQSLTDRTGYKWKRTDLYNIIQKINENMPEENQLRKQLSKIQVEGGTV